MLRAEIDYGLDIIELSIQMMTGAFKYASNTAANGVKAPLTGASEAVKELNHRFREHSIGYKFESDMLIRVDSEFIHTEVVQPALALLHRPGFAGPLDEFLKAHEYYRHNDNRQAIVEALKAFESTMKTICGMRNWSYPPNATASVLIDALFNNGLIPADLLSEFQALGSVLKSGLPTVRNKPGRGHGQGSAILDVPDYLAAYALHLAAANVVFLIEAHLS